MMTSRKKFNREAKRLLACAFLVGLPLLVQPVFANPETSAPAPSVNPADNGSFQPTREVIYKRIGGWKLRLFVFEPQGHRPSDRRPCFLFIHGGGWAGGSPDVVYKYASHFAEQGMVGMSLEYRKWNKAWGTTVFDCVKDGRSAVRYLRAHATELGIDPGKIIVSGGSAGGHIALGTALFQGVDESTDDLNISCLPNAIIPLYPVVDTSKQGCGNAALGDRWEELSPLARIRPGLPPTLLFHCTGDTTCPFIGAKRFHEAMVQAGNRCELIVHEGGDHVAFSKNPELYNQSLVKMREFLTKVGIITK